MIDLIDMVRLLFRREKKPYLRLKSILGFYPHNLRFYNLALVHKSVAYEMRKQGVTVDSKTGLNNERLEFLGDAILGAVVADILYKKYGHKQEGFLTSLRSKIVCRASLNKLAVEIGLDKLIHHAGAVSSGHNSYMNGNAFEAFFGAIYLDRGYRYCYRFMDEVVFRKHINIERISNEDGNFKSMLIEWCQKYQYNYRYTQREWRDAKDHNVPMFRAEVLIEEVKSGEGEGYSKKEAHQKAAREALNRIKRDKAFVASLREAKAERKAKSKEQSERDKARNQAEAAAADAAKDAEATMAEDAKDVAEVLSGNQPEVAAVDIANDAAHLEAEQQ